VSEVLATTVESVDDESVEWALSGLGEVDEVARSGS
jgi:hypothetical protein